jgi:hypothetical protein
MQRDFIFEGMQRDTPHFIARVKKMQRDFFFLVFDTLTRSSFWAEMGDNFCVSSPLLSHPSDASTVAR